MPRLMGGDDADLFRAVVTTTVRGVARTEYVGPYRSKAAATQALNREKAEGDRANDHEKWYAQRVHRAPVLRTVEGHVERAAVTWERVE